jgi:hypothetical protein
MPGQTFLALHNRLNHGPRTHVNFRIVVFILDKTKAIKQILHQVYPIMKNIHPELSLHSVILGISASKGCVDANMFNTDIRP